MKQEDNMEQLEKAHKYYEQCKQGVIVDLLSLKNAIYTTSRLGIPIDQDMMHEFTTVLEKTIYFVKLKEV